VKIERGIMSECFGTMKERVAYIFRVKEYAKQETSLKQIGLPGLFFDPGNRGGLFF
jgi:hypothetical protein